jgi:hypothetical protein
MDQLTIYSPQMQGRDQKNYKRVVTVDSTDLSANALVLNFPDKAQQEFFTTFFSQVRKLTGTSAMQPFRFHFKRAGKWYMGNMIAIGAENSAVIQFPREGGKFIGGIFEVI